MDSRKIGWVCSYIPEEIILAAGLQPYRVTGDYQRVQLADTQIPSNYCSFVRNCLDAAMRGEYDFLDGMVFTNSCHAGTLLYELWREQSDNKFLHIIDLPRKATEGSTRYFAKQLSAFADELRRYFKVNIERSSLEKAVEFCNRKRSLFNKIFELRRRGSPGYSAAELLALIVDEEHLDGEDYLAHLAAFYERWSVAQGDTTSRKRPRIMLLGCIVAHPDLLSLFEQAGGELVHEDRCNAEKHYDGLVLPGDDIYQMIGRRYLYRDPCPRMFDDGQRCEQLLNRVSEYAVDGVVYYSIKFCSSHSIKAAEIREAFQAADIPFLYIEGDHSLMGTEQLRTRIETFIDML